MTYSDNTYPQLWFDIYKVVCEENNQLEDPLEKEQITSVTTSIFISITQRNKFKRPTMFNRFQNEVVKLVEKVKDRNLQESIYKSLKTMVKETR